ncbi:lauroyl acyltransferase [Lysobacter zhanggongensis]|uniref:Lauroyl acyltransferase n=1 Tax=Lysobacter zhanggongensis TaxID=1774951 RepID=A0ABU7YQG7_9GAMM
MTRLAARLLFLFATLVARLPWRWLTRLADALADAAIRRSSREARITARNLELVRADASADEHAELQRAVMRSTTRQVFETLRLWTGPRTGNLAMIREVHGAAHLDAAIAAGNGVIVAAPHFGNWELLNQWLAARTPLAILYAPPESRVGEAFLNLARADEDAARITQVRADGAGVRQLFKRLAAGGVVGILPDQQPKRGDGEFAPFFGLQALTMTLLGRLATRSGAIVLMAWCERIDDEGRGPAFALHVEPAPAAVSDPDPATSAAALNAAVERIARRDPAQYQWTYKRFSVRPPGSGEENPYWPGCY